MKKQKKELFSHIINVVAVALIVECFLCSFLVVRQHAREDCFTRIEETTRQVSDMFNHAMDENYDKLIVFADILAANSTNPDKLLQTYMENFCRTQYFTSMCIHRANGTTVSWGDHLHGVVDLDSYEEEAAKLPYLSKVYKRGDTADAQYFYQAVPIIRAGQTVAILYGFMPLDILPNFFSSAAYNGMGQYYVVDGNTGDFLMDTWHDSLGNLDEMGERETKRGYDTATMRREIREGKAGYFIFKSRTVNEWFYTYYMPLGINNWSIQMTIDEPTAFENYNEVTKTVMVLGLLVIFFMITHLLALMWQNGRAKQKDKVRLHKSRYMYAVQRDLLNAHNNADYIELALKTVANELEAETVMLLTFADRTVSNTYYYPSSDKSQAMDLLGRNIRDDFPTLFDKLSENKTVFYDENDPSLTLTEGELTLTRGFDIRQLMVAPIMDNSGLLRGTLCAVNVPSKKADGEMLACVTYDFFMAITNVENHNIIKHMGAMDYLTGIKNRNSYESELSSYAAHSGRTLSCVFVDVNGLHEVNNIHGHKAGDRMLCTVADAMRKIFGSRNTYRFGGDEFVAFVADATHEALLEQKKTLIATLAALGYHVSVGFESIEKTNGIFDVEQVVASAEAIMYREKREFYQTNNLDVTRASRPKYGQKLLP